MKTIGIITLWAKNYGSVLQCYSLKHIIKNMGYYPQVYFQNEKGITKIIYRIKMIGTMIVNTMLYPNYLDSYKKMKRAGKVSVNSLSASSLAALNLFVKHSISPIGVTYHELKLIAKEKQTAYFVCGSDQIWNGSVPYNKVSFLEFAPKNKRVAYAPSFGTLKIENYNKRKFGRSISKIPFLSVREEAGVDIIFDLCKKKAVRMPDPTFLLTDQEWNKFCSESKFQQTNYILIHFLDKPNNIAIKTIKELKLITGKKLLTFGYPHRELHDLGVEHIDGGPREYISIIKFADYICTDSFHTTIFSIRLSRQFYVFYRQYVHDYDQSSRIKTLLNDCGYSERLIENYRTFRDLPKRINDVSAFFSAERAKGIKYISDIVSPLNKKQTIPNIKSNECTGCGLCANVCQFDAIKLSIDTYGSLIPIVDKNKCIQCGRCEKVCKSTLENIYLKPRKAYIAYNINCDDLKRSASGGVFSALAKKIIENDGIVYGAKLSFENGVKIKHVAVENLNDLKAILQSKYVESDCSCIYNELKKTLNKGKYVLFGGTSCQVAAVKKYLGKEYDNLFLVDLICHGVPGEDFFRKYIKFLENKYHSKIIDFSFRNKRNGRINYEETINFVSGKQVVIPWRESEYYLQFLRCESYRESCYYCKYASVDKPADITIGDYFEARDDYPDLYKQSSELSNVDGISCLIVQNQKGERLLKEFGENLKLFSVDLDTVQNSHNQLCFPSIHTRFRKKLFKLYSKGGFYQIAKYYKFQKIALLMPKKVYRILIRFINI